MQLTSRQTVAGRVIKQNTLGARVQDVDTIGFGGGAGVVWERQLSNVFPEYSEYFLSDLVKLADGDFAALCEVYPPSSSGLNKLNFVFKFNEAGTLLWKKEMNYISAMYAIPGGGLVAVGDSVVKLNSNGIIEWKELVPDTLLTNNTEITACDDGGYLIAGNQNSSVFQSCNSYQMYIQKLVLVKLDASGNILWSKKHLVGRTSGGSALGLMKTNTGFIISSSTRFADVLDSCSLSNTDDDIFAIKTDVNGSLLWEKQFGGQKEDYYAGILPAIDSGYLLLLQTNSIDGDLTGLRSDTLHSGSWILTIGENGEIISNKTYSFSNDKSEVLFRGIRYSDSAYVFVGDVFYPVVSNYDFAYSGIMAKVKKTVQLNGKRYLTTRLFME